jgi:hypothetical protein
MTVLLANSTTWASVTPSGTSVTTSTSFRAKDLAQPGCTTQAAFIVSKDNGTVHCFHSSCIVDGKAVIRVGKKAAGRLLDGITHDGFPA